MNKKYNPMELLENLNNEQPIVKTIYVYGWENNGGSSYYHNLYSSVSKYLFEPLDIIEAMIPQELDNRPNIIKENTKYITVHDTATAGPKGGAEFHKRYVVGGGGGTSWHYTVGNDGIFHHIPNNEVAYHAGDGSRTFTLTDSGVFAKNEKPEVGISEDGYYTLDGVKSLILAPDDNGNVLSASVINDMGIKISVGENGNYLLGNTWYSNFYKKIGNGGGNRNSIGIESCIDAGSDVYLTWQKLAKLVAYLLEEQNLGFDAIVQHHYFSGKDCPMTMRHAQLWVHFLDLVKAEYLIRTNLKDYTISFKSNSKFINEKGRIIDLPEVESQESFTIKITNSNGETQVKDFQITLPAKNK